MSKEKSSLFWSPVEDGYAVVSDEQARVGEEAQSFVPQEIITFLDVEIAQPRVEQIRQILDVAVDIERINFWLEGSIELEVFSLLASCRSLRELGVYDDENALTVEHFAEIAQMSSLRKLYLGCSNLSKAMFAPLAEMKHLEAFSLEESEGVEPEILRVFQHMKGLRELSLELNDPMIEEMSLGFEVSLRLTHLSLCYEGQKEGLSFEDGLPFLRTMRGLRSLSLTRMHINHTHMHDINRLTDVLEALTLVYCEMPKGTLEMCVELRNLRVLDLSFYTDEGTVDWSFLEKLNSLEEFVFFCPIAPKSLLQILPSLPHLKKCKLGIGEMSTAEKESLLSRFPKHIAVEVDAQERSVSEWVGWLVWVGAFGVIGGGGYALLSFFGKLTEGWLMGLFFLAFVGGLFVESFFSSLKES